MRQAHLLILLFGFSISFSFSISRGQDIHQLLERDQLSMGWRFGNGPEFPGAKGGLSIDESVKLEGKTSLHLKGDFTGGGNYVETLRNFDADVRVLTMTIKAGGIEQFTLRLIDSSDQCHQFNIKCQKTDDWQKITLPVAEFFEKRGKAGAITSIGKYESWGGKKDSAWHGPGKAIALLLGPAGEQKVRDLWLGEVSIVSGATGPAVADVPQSLPLEEVADGEIAWGFNPGTEFPGAKGEATVAKGASPAGKDCLKLAGDFTGGGAYIGVNKDLKELDAPKLTALRFKIKTSNVTNIGIRLIDETGQCHQRTGIKIKPDGNWQEIILKPDQVAGGEHWGGKNDGKWHGAAQLLAINVGKGSSPDNKPELLIADSFVDALVPATASPVEFKGNFETGSIPEGWQINGPVSIDSTTAFKGKSSLALARSMENEQAVTNATSSPIAVTPGLWEFSFAVKSELNSPDASYRGVVTLNLLDASNKVTKQINLADTYGPRNWMPISKRIEIPAGVSSVTFKTEILKAGGKFYIDELSASFLNAVVKKDDRINRITFDSAQLGNLLYPTDPRTFTITVEATKPLKENQYEITWIVRDYWGAEQSAPGKVKLANAPKKNNRLAYTAEVSLAGITLDIGRYYELYAQIAQENDEPFRNYTSFAILPEAITKKYKPEDVPFTSRNWDNRLPAYITLSDRLGIRIAGVWGGFDAATPEKPIAPTIEVLEKLGMGVVTGMPSGAWEQQSKGYENYTDEVLRAGTKAWIAKYKHIKPLIISLGNEPHGKGQRVIDQVKAYKSVYESAKEADPSVIVIGTSVGPEEEYFAAGMGKYLDAYDFHIYEDYRNVRLAVEKYHKLFEKYGNPKPIWTTEIGLNSQGMARQSVASEVIKKFTDFFAAGGANVSWFGILYPDTNGTDAGSSGSAHNVFDCRYNKYCPKLDAIAYYNMVNAIAVKKFVEQKDFGDYHAYLYRDAEGNSLQVWWKERGRGDVQVPLNGVSEVLHIGIDGRRNELHAGGRGLTLTIGEDPILLLYKGGDEKLPTDIGQPGITIAQLPASVITGDSVDLDITTNGVPPERVSIFGVPGWSVNKTALPGKVRFSISPPAGSSVREGDLLVQLHSDSGIAGLLSARMPVSGKLSMRLLPNPSTGENSAGVKLVVKNNSTEKQDILWKLAIPTEVPMVRGSFKENASQPSAAHFAAASEGAATIKAGESFSVIVPLASVDRQTSYKVSAVVTDSTGRMISQTRPMGGFVGVPKALQVKVDGKVDEVDWSRATPVLISEDRQYRAISKDELLKWNGPDDLSAKVRYLWDDKNLYIAVEVTDDVFANPKQDSSLWAMDGLQFLVDPAREFTQKPGKYDYSLGLTQTKGNQAWCHLTASSESAQGEVKDFQIATVRGDKGNITYEIAMPWSRLAPFKPVEGNNLGWTVVLNEDDGKGRHVFMGWFGDVQEKNVDFSGDLILTK